jgi:ATP-dependent RNA helicase DDX19/DBP5
LCILFYVYLGKTAAFCLGLLSRIDESKHEPQAIVVCPTRELAQQVTDVARSLAKYTKITIETVVPKTRQEMTSAAAVNPTSTDTRAAPSAPSGKQQIVSQLLVGTPGSLKQRIDIRAINIRSIRVFVADEADQMVSREEGLGDQTIAIKSKMPRDCQILLFSATFDGKTSDFAKRVAPRAVEIRIKTEELSLEGIKQFYVESRSPEEKYTALSSIFPLLEIGATIIFVQTVATAKWLTNQMRADGYTVSLLHGKDMLPEERDRVMNDFRQNKTNVLITTNVLARGIDVLTVTLVINYDIPVTKYHRADFSTYIHRIGRSGRFGRKGVAINFVSDEMSKRLLQEIAEHFSKKLDVDVVRLPVEDIEKSSALVQKALGK